MCFLRVTPDCPKCSSVCHNPNKEVWRHYSSAASTPLASSTAANHLQVGDDHLQMPLWSGAVLRVYPRFVRHRQVAAAVGRQRDTRRAAYKEYDRSARLCGIGRSDMEQLPIELRTSTLSLHRDIRTKTQKSSLWLLAPVGTLSNWLYVNLHIHSFIHLMTE